VPNTGHRFRLSEIAAARQESGRARCELKHDLTVSDHAELVPCQALHCLRIFAQRLHFQGPLLNLSRKAQVFSADVFELIVELPVARQPVFAQDAQRYTHYGEHEEPEGQEPGDRTSQRHDLQVWRGPAQSVNFPSPFSRELPRMFRTALGIALSTLLLAMGACATLPTDRAERALYIDARKALNGEHRLGWTIDRVEIEEAAAQAEPSACQIDPQKRKDLMAWVRVQIAAQGGPAAQRYKQGDDRSDLDDLIDLEQTLALLEAAERHLPEDCPFWLKPDPEFNGTHNHAERFMIIAESMGAGSLLMRSGQVRVAGGGSARVLGGYGLSSRLQLAAGIEGGGDAVLEKDEEGALSPSGAFRFGAPMWLRLHDIDRIYDVELAAISRFEDGQFKPWGVRAALGGGVTGLRRLGFMPALEVWLGYEVFPAQDGESAQHALRLGTRVGFDYAL